MNKKTLLGVFPCAQIFKGPTATLLLGFSGEAARRQKITFYASETTAWIQLKAVSLRSCSLSLRFARLSGKPRVHGAFFFIFCSFVATLLLGFSGEAALS